MTDLAEKYGMAPVAPRGAASSVAAALAHVPDDLPNAALYYASLGWRLLPLHSIKPIDGVPRCTCGAATCTAAGKHPLVKNGEATNDPKTIKTWWKKWPWANIGFWLEESGLAVLDIDQGEGKDGAAVLRTLLNGKPIPETLVCATPSGGKHIYYRDRASLPNKSNALGTGLDIWRGKHYLILPPSHHRSGGIYQWENVRDPAAWPVNLRPRDGKRPVGRPPKAQAPFDSSNPAERTRLAHALTFVDASDRDTWVQFTYAIARECNWSDEGFEIANEWAATAPNFDAKKTRRIYYRDSKNAPTDGQQPITVASIFTRAKNNPAYEKLIPPRDRDHYHLATAFIAAIQSETGERPVYVSGSFWIARDCLWCAWAMEQVAVEVAQRFAGGKYCQRGADFKSVAQLACSIVEDKDFFNNAPVGIAAPGGFWRVTDKGEIERVPLQTAHRQRSRVSADPDKTKKPTLLLKVLAEAFSGHEPEAQTTLVQQLIGCAVTRSLWLHQIAALFLGASKSGKSTTLTVCRSVFPKDQVTATSPHRWADEYYVAVLAGAALNVVGELDKRDPIPGGAFKTIVGRDIAQGRHPTHRPFSFVCSAAHFFNANRTPPTTDHGDAFFNRWRIVYFANTKPAKERILDLDEQLIKESGAFLWWALEGAAEVAKAGTIIETETSRNQIQKWRRENNSALAFIHDVKHCAFNPGATTTGQALYLRYKGWAKGVGLMPFGRNGFYEALMDGAASAAIDIEMIEDGHQLTVKGVELVPIPKPEWQADDAPRF